MPRHKVFDVIPTISNGFDVAAVDGVTYMRVIVDGRPTHAVPHTAAELRQFAASVLNAADLLDQLEAGRA